jgi:hypothetical protein
MRRAALFLLVAATSFALTLWFRDGSTAAAPASELPASAAESESAGPPAAPPSSTPPPPRRRVVQMTNERLSTFQKLQLETPAEANALNNAVVEATAKARYERGANLEDCATAEAIPGPQAIRFATAVTSDERTFRAEPWRFIEVVDGSHIPPEVIVCMERALGGPYDGTRPQHAAFPAAFAGDIELIYRMRSFAAP